ncbi:MAG: hypothetical protein ACXVPQ_04795 [Bacteroidia bacterium]
MLALLIHIITAYFSVGYHHGDELFQIYEFAGYKLGLNSASTMPWEFHEKIRPGLQPLIVYGFTKFFSALSVSDPFTVSLFLRLCQSLLSFFAIVQLLRYFETELQDEHLKKIYWWAGLLWWCLPYFHARLSSENFSSTLFLLGLVLILRERGRWWHFMLAGLLFGLSFLCRFQLGFMVFGCCAWLLFVNRSPFKFLLVLFSGVLAALAIGAFVDQWLYGEPVLSWWNYLDANFFKDKASIYGREPFYFFFVEAVLQLIPPFSIFMIAGLIFFWIKFPRHVLTWITLPFVFLHFFVGHKELRFLFPMLNFLPPMLLLVYQRYNASGSRPMPLLRSKAFAGLFIAVNSAALISFSLWPADHISSALAHIYKVSEGKEGTLLYSDNNPYNTVAALNYFRNGRLRTLALADSVSLDSLSGPLYYYTETPLAGKEVRIRGRRFQKVYSNFPDWIRYVNFNHWVDRVLSYSVYKTL